MVVTSKLSKMEVLVSATFSAGQCRRWSVVICAICPQWRIFALRRSSPAQRPGVDCMESAVCFGAVRRAPRAMAGPREQGTCMPYGAVEL